MIKRFALIGTFTLVLVAAALPGYAQTHVSIGIGAAFYSRVAVVPAAPYPGYAWQPAHYVWTAFGYQLVQGGWVPSPYVVHRRAYVAQPVVAAPYYAPYYSPYYSPYYAPYYAPRGLSLGFGFNVGHRHGFNVGHGRGFNVGHGRGFNVGHGRGFNVARGGHHGRHR